MFHCCCCWVTKLCLTFCDPMNCSTPGFSVLHHLPELAQTHVHWVSDAIQLSHLLSCPSLPAFDLSQHQGLLQSQLFESGGQSIGALNTVPTSLFCFLFCNFPISPNFSREHWPRELSSTHSFPLLWYLWHQDFSPYNAFLLILIPFRF